MMTSVKEGLKKMNGNGNGRAAGWEWFWRLLSVLVIPWAMWISITLVDAKERIAVMEGNRFTSKDGMALSIELAKRPTRIEVRQDYPPAWLIERLAKAEAAIQRHEEGR